MNNVKDYLKKIQTSDLSFETQQKALLELEKSIQEAKDKLIQKEVKVTQNVEYIVSAFKNIEDKINKKYEEILNVSIQKGEKGEQGPAGKNGKDGANGLNGKDGFNGKDGADGKDGVSVVDAYIDFDGSLVIKLSDGTDIDAGKVVSDAVAKEVNNFMTRGEILPLQDGQAGKFLTTDGTILSWATASGGAVYPDQTGKEDFVLSTDGTDALWTQDFSKLNLMGY
jgi:hypothetical protein